MLLTRPARNSCLYDHANTGFRTRSRVNHDDYHACDLAVKDQTVALDVFQTFSLSTNTLYTFFFQTKPIFCIPPLLFHDPLVFLPYLFILSPCSLLSKSLPQNKIQLLGICRQFVTVTTAVYESHFPFAPFLKPQDSSSASQSIVSPVWGSYVADCLRMPPASKEGRGGGGWEKPGKFGSWPSQLSQQQRYSIFGALIWFKAVAATRSA